MLAQEAADQLDLDEVLLVPVGISPYKPITPEPGAQVRYEMAELAAAGDELLSASDIETSREGPSFTYRTLELLNERRRGDDFCFLMGADVAAGFCDWREPQRVLELARLGVASRSGTALAEAQEAMEAMGARDRVAIVEMPEIAVSSTDIRRRVAAERPIRHLVPAGVAALIAERGMYRA